MLCSQNCQRYGRRVEHTVELEGPAPFLDIVFETIDAHLDRTGEEYVEIITGVDAADAGDVDREQNAVLYLYGLGDVELDEARELIDLALDRIADEHNMDLARYNVRVRWLMSSEEGSFGIVASAVRC